MFSVCILMNIIFFLKKGDFKVCFVESFFFGLIISKLEIYNVIFYEISYFFLKMSLELYL